MSRTRYRILNKLPASGLTAARSLASRSGKHGPSSRKAFTLLETMMALVIIGVGVLAFVDAQASFTASNNWSSRAATGMLLANEVRELSRRLPRHDPVTGLTLTVTGGGSGSTLAGWGPDAGEITVDDIDDLDDLDGLTFGESGAFEGPVDAFGDVIPDIMLDGSVRSDNEGFTIPLRGWSQRITVEKVSPYDFNTVLADAAVEPATASMAAADVDDFPLRITVAVDYTDASTGDTIEITRVTWVVPVE